jgi:ribosomal protein S27E
MDYSSTHPSSPHLSFAAPNCQHKRFVRNTLRVSLLIARLCEGNRNVLKTNNLRCGLSPMDGRLYRQRRQNKDVADAIIFSLETLGKLVHEAPHSFAPSANEWVRLAITRGLPSFWSPRAMGEDLALDSGLDFFDLDFRRWAHHPSWFLSGLRFLSALASSRANVTCVLCFRGTVTYSCNQRRGRCVSGGRTQCADRRGSLKIKGDGWQAE